MEDNSAENLEASIEGMPTCSGDVRLPKLSWQVLQGAWQ
jgi:hypothetical protein